MTLDGLWRYRSGDSSAWASPDYDDNDWPVTDPFIQWDQASLLRWDGLGWFRFDFYADSSLWNKTLAIRIEQLGASQVFYNGKLLYSFGEIGSTASEYHPNAMTWWQEIKVDPQYDQIIAVRYANRDWKRLQHMGYMPGFLISLKNINRAFRDAVDVRQTAERQVMFVLIPLILAVVHLSLYGFLRNQRQNLYYAACMLGFAGLTYFIYVQNLVVDVDRIVLYGKLTTLSVGVAILFGVLTVLELNYTRLPRRTRIYVGMFALIICLSLLDFSIGFVMTINYVFFGMTTFETIYTLFNRNVRQHRGRSLLFAGFLFMTTFIVLQMLVDYGVLPRTPVTSQMYVYGMLSLAIAMSVFLSYDFARVNKDLADQLMAVRRMSDEAFEQQRIAHTLELERTTIELESERKSKELESARALQLSLLPKQVPRLKGLDIAATMKTASEVGGDYYDFFLSDNGDLIVVVGDATGHGVKAGSLVTATKGLLGMLTGNDDVAGILAEANKAIKRMNLPMLTMCLAVARIKGNTLSYASAGMPPLLLYRGDSRRVEQCVLKAMPLGAVAQFPYTGALLTLRQGDVVVMASDGLLELFDEQRETYGIDNIMQSLIVHAGKPAEEIVQGLFEDGRTWSGNAALADDLTIVVVKVMEDVVRSE